MLPNICHFCGRFSISKNLLWMFGNFWFRKLCGHWNRKVWITVEKLNGPMSSRFVHFPPISTEITTFSIDTLWFYHLIITFIIKWSTTKEIWAVQEHCILPLANGNGWNWMKLFPPTNQPHCIICWVFQVFFCSTFSHVFCNSTKSIANRSAAPNDLLDI